MKGFSYFKKQNLLLALPSISVVLAFQNCAKTSFASNNDINDQLAVESQSAVLAQGESRPTGPLVNRVEPPSVKVRRVTQRQAGTVSQPVLNQPTAAAPMSPSAPQLTAPQQNRTPASTAGSTTVNYPDYSSASTPVVWQFRYMTVSYGSPMQSLGANSGQLLEAGNRTLLKDENREATYEEIAIIKASLVIESAERISPTSVTLTECQLYMPNICRTSSLDPNTLDWTLHSGEEASMFVNSFNQVCFDSRQSVAEKRGIPDCLSSRGIALINIINSDASKFKSELNAPVRGTIFSFNSRDYVSGKFIVRASITNETPGFSHYAGASSDYSVQLVNRLDLQLTVNQSLFSSYGTSLVTVNMVGANGLEDATAFQNISCSATTSAGNRITMNQRKYENRFSLNSVMSNFPVGTTVVVECHATDYNGQTAVARFIEEKKF